MSVTASDIVVYGSATMPEDDTTTAIGGAIDTTTTVVFTDLTTASTLEVLSSNAGDTTQTLTVYGRDSTGIAISETVSLNGTTVVSLTNTYGRLLKAVLSGAATGTVTLRIASAGGDLMVFAPGVLTVRRPFYDALADAAGGTNKVLYEKVFFRNNNTSTALTSAQIIESADPSGLVAFGLAGTLGDTATNGTGNTRLTAPTGITIDTASKNVANSGNHSPSSAQGVWLSLTLNAGTAASSSTFTLEETGNTT